mgnify:CR=1 FL=1
MNKEIKDLESYHEGRHACRDKYKKSNLLVINPHIDIVVKFTVVNTLYFFYFL